MSQDKQQPQQTQSKQELAKMDTSTAVPPMGSAGHAHNSVEPSPSPSPRPTRALKHMPSMQRVNTTFSQSFIVTPASAHSTSSIAPSPSWSSLQGSPVPNQSQSQLQSTMYPLSYVEPLTLPEAVSYPPTSMGNTMPNTPRQNGLTRKLSSGRRALSRLGRTASGNSSRRNASSGPVARRRSDSKTSTAAAFETKDPVPDLPEGLGMYYSVNSPEDTGSVSDCHIHHEQRAEVIAPSVPGLLVGGTWLVKITRRRRSEKLFSLDKEGSKVSWINTVKRKEFYIDDIKSIRLGVDVESLWAEIAGTEIDIDCCFTINYAPSESSKATKSLNLVAPTRDLCQLWVKTLDALAKHREELMSEMTGTERQSVLRTHWEGELEKQNIQDDNMAQEGLGLVSVARLCRKLHIHCPKSVIEDSFKVADTRGIGLLNFEEFRAFVARLRSRVDLRPLFNQLREPHIDGIARDTFFNFLRNEQAIDIDTAKAYWEERFETIASKARHVSSDDSLDHYIDFAGFISFIMSKDCHVYSTGPEKLRPNLDRPLNEYFISSSHNTYLVGWQVNGTSSMEAYMTALRRGCRSVEIDCWNGENGEPRVTHGFTNTTSVAFVDVIRVINRCAFEASPYPVTLSLEVHCNPTQQQRMVEIMKEYIEPGRLVMITLPQHEKDLPSPEELMFKILVKVKATNAHPILAVSTDLQTPRKRSTSSPVRRPTPMHSNSSQHFGYPSGSPYMMSPPESIYSPTDRSISPTSEEDESDASLTAKINVANAGAARKTSKITTELAALGVYLQGYSFGNPQDLEFQQFNHIFSINENAAAALSKNQETKTPFEKHNTSYMCRVYPKNVRLNSSNFDPNTFWRRGVQMVALNWQTYDIHMQMNQAMFAAGNDQSGYVLKPHYLRDPHRFGGYPEARAKLPRHRISFSVKIISAQQLPLLSTLGRGKLISPYVEVQMFSAEDKARGIAYGQGGEDASRSDGYHGIGMPYARRTKTVPENGFNPQFNDVIDLSLDTKYPELVFVRFVVNQSGKNSGKELAVFTAKLDSLQQGYRHLPLYNSRGEELIFSTLFCQITKRPNTVALPEIQPERSHSLRKLLSRSNTAERGRPRGHTLADSERLAAQKKLNQEIEAKRR